MKTITLTKGKEALVDDVDFDYLTQWEWTSLVCPHTDYAARGERVDGLYSKILMHRVIAERMGLSTHRLQVDHRDRYGLNNQRYNLFAVTKAINQQNASLRADSTSGFRGVNFNTLENKWRARIQVGKSRVCLGMFSRFEDAVAARLAAEERYYTWRQRPRTDASSSS
jgi:hypothetical protein